MDIVKNVFLAISIILLAFGAWPIALLTATVCLTLSIVSDIQQKKDFQKLQAEVQKLRQEFQNQVVQNAMDRAEKRKQEVEK